MFGSRMPSSKSGPPLGLDANGRPTRVGIAFGLFAAAFMFSVDVIFGYAAVRQLWACTYETTTGTVLSNDINRVSGKGGSSSFELNVAYSYRVGKNEYLGRAIRYGQNASFRTEARARAAFPVEAKVVVYYNHRHPGDAVLLRGLQGSDLMWGLFLLPFNLVFGPAGLGTILWLIAPAKWMAKWNAVPTGIRSCDDGIVATLRCYPFPPWAAAIAGGGVTAFFMIFLVGFGEEAFDPTFSFSIVGWCGVLVVASIVYWSVRRSPTLLEINRSAGQVILHRPGQSPKSFAIVDVADAALEEVSSDSACGRESCPSGVSFNAVAVLHDRGQGKERVLLHTDTTHANALQLVTWMRDRVVAT